MMDAAYIAYERNSDQREHHDENDALLVLGELKNPEQAFHFFA
jgi:hypothetical protein